MSLIPGERRRLKEGRVGGGVVRGLRGHHGGGRPHAGSTPRPVVQPLEKLRGFEGVTHAEDWVGELLVGDVMREEGFMIGHNSGNGDTGPPGAGSAAVTVVVVESCPRRFRERVSLSSNPGDITRVFPHRWETGATIQNGIYVARVRWLRGCPAFPVKDYPASNQSNHDYKC